MKNVNLPVWLLLLLAILVIGLSLATAFGWRRGNNFRGDVAGFEEQLSDARNSQRELADKLDRVRDAYHRVEGELDSATAELKASQNRVGELENELERGRESGAEIGAAVSRIGEWIERVEEANAPAEG